MSEGAEPSPDHDPAGGAPADAMRAARAELAFQLRGRLPCWRCGYDLGGLSIRGVCPECGTPIRATLLTVVDPHARELQPVHHARLVVAGLMAWSLGALGAALMGSLVDVVPLVAPLMQEWSPRWASRAGAGCIVISGIGALALVRPHARIPRGQMAGAAAAVVGTFVLAGLSLWIWTRYPAFSAAPAIAGLAPSLDGTLARLAQAGVLALVIIGLRPNARLLEARSLLLRSGRVDRQTLYAVAGAVGVAGAGHVVNLIALMLRGRVLDVALSAGTVLIAVGWMLLTIGLVGVLIDVLRLCPVLLEPSPSLGSLLKGGARPAARSGGRAVASGEEPR